ncbi:unnamed protein product, partial [Phaeothamnion confervicola]
MEVASPGGSSPRYTNDGQPPLMRLKIRAMTAPNRPDGAVEPADFELEGEYPPAADGEPSDQFQEAGPEEGVPLQEQHQQQQQQVPQEPPQMPPAPPLMPPTPPLMPPAPPLMPPAPPLMPPALPQMPSAQSHVPPVLQEVPLQMSQAPPQVPPPQAPQTPSQVWQSAAPVPLGLVQRSPEQIPLPPPAVPQPRRRPWSATADYRKPSAEVRQKYIGQEVVKVLDGCNSGSDSAQVRGQVVSFHGKTRHFVVEYQDGTMEEASFSRLNGLLNAA